MLILNLIFTYHVFKSGLHLKFIKLIYYMSVIHKSMKVLTFCKFLIDNGYLVL